MATPIVAASSSTEPDRKLIRSVSIVARRYRSLTSPTIAASSRARPNARSVGRPRTTSRKWLESARNACHRSRVRSCGVRADQPHEHRHEWQRQQHDHRGLEVQKRDPGDHQERDDRREHDLRQVAREVAFERLYSLHRDGRDLGAAGAVDRRRMCPQSALDEGQAKLREDAPGRAAASDLHRPGERAPHRECDYEQGELRPELAQRRAVEGSRGDPGEHRRSEQHGEGGADPERGVEDQQRPRRLCPAEQARVESAHGSTLLTG